MAISTLAQIREVRINKAEELRKLGIDPYPSKSKRTHKIKQITDNFDQLNGQAVTLSGRLISWREHGHLVFGDIQDDYGKVQLYIKTDELLPTNKDQQTIGFEHLGLIDVGDIIQATGIVTKTQRGEISLLPKSLQILTKAIRPLPDKWTGITDKETLFRQRYLDMIMNPEKKWRFAKTAEITFAIRSFLTSKGFLEIKTPFLQPVYGGTNAKPFRTHVNALGIDFYLSVAHELYLKRLITAGYEKVFNINGYFRNEGIDRTHNPEFSMVETMSAYENYTFNMDLIEEMYKYISETVFNKTTFIISGQEVDFGKPWERLSILEAVKKHTNYDFNEVTTLEQAHKILDEINYSGDKPKSIGESMVKVFEEKVEDNLIQPTFITGHPVEISPLAKTMSSDPRFVERFEIFIGGIEGGDNWTELNDPVELYKRLSDQVEKGRGGDDEAHPMDIEFLEAMEYGMPPTTGLGPGVERLAMMMTETEYIDDVLFFPMMRPTQVTNIQKEIYGEKYLEVDQISHKHHRAEHSDQLNNSSTDNVILSDKVCPESTEGKNLSSPKKQDFSKKMVLLINREVAGWQLTNTIGHITAFLGAEIGKSNFSSVDKFETKEGESIPSNCQYPVISFSGKPGQMYNFLQKVEEAGLIHIAYTQEMIDFNEDDELSADLKTKNKADLNYLGIGVFGEHDTIDALTKKFSLYK